MKHTVELFTVKIESYPFPTEMRYYKKRNVKYQYTALEKLVSCALGFKIYPTLYFDPSKYPKQMIIRMRRYLRFLNYVCIKLEEPFYILAVKIDGELFFQGNKHSFTKNEKFLVLQTPNAVIQIFGKYEYYKKLKRYENEKKVRDER